MRKLALLVGMVAVLFMCSFHAALAAPSPVLTLVSWTLMHKYVEIPPTLGGWMQGEKWPNANQPTTTNEWDYGARHEEDYQWRRYKVVLKWTGASLPQPCTKITYTNDLQQSYSSQYWYDCSVNLCPEPLRERANFAPVDQAGAPGCGDPVDTYERRSQGYEFLDIAQAVPGAMYLVRLTVNVTKSNKLCPLYENWSDTSPVPSYKVTVAGQDGGIDDTVDVWVASDQSLNVTPICSGVAWYRWTITAKILKEDL